MSKARRKSTELDLGQRDHLARKAAEEPGLISFAGGLPDPGLFPTRELGRALQTALSDTDALQYGWPEGTEQLRAYIAAGLAARGATVTADRVIVTSGAQQAIALALGVLPARGIIGVERESYPGALDLIKGARHRVGALADTAGAYYVMPSVSNPRGQRMNAEQRQALLERATRHRALLIEDDAYDGTWFNGDSSAPLLAEAPERVFHVGTFSKTLCPGLRIGWLVPPPKLARRVLRQKQNQDLQANSLAQALLERYLQGDQFDRHQRRARFRYRRKAAALMRSVARELPDLRFSAPGGGFSLWLEGDFKIDEKALLAASIDAGVAFDPGYLFRSLPYESFALRLCYSNVAEADIDEGVRRLAATLANARGVNRGGNGRRRSVARTVQARRQ